jgi:hypothetical protein
MNGLEFRDWCEESDGEYTEDRMGANCRLPNMTVNYEGDDMTVTPAEPGMISHFEGPADEFFNMGRAQLATEVGDHSIIFQ